MARIRRHSRHARRKKGGNSIYLAALLLLAMAVIWLLTADLESSVAFKWMTGSQGMGYSDEVEVKIFDGGQFGVVAGDSIPRWIAASPQQLKQNDTIAFQSEQFGKRYKLPIQPQQMPLWNDYVRHAQYWAGECDTLYLVYGMMPDSQALYSINLCIEENSRGQGIIIPNEITDQPFFNYTHSINEIERKTRINFFEDLLDEESEAYIEKYHQRFQWLYPKEFYNKRIEENKRINHGHK